MRNRPVAYNLLRGLLGSMHTTPRGIERIDFGFASHLFREWPTECVGVLPMPWGMRFYSRDRILRALDRLADTWQESTDVKGDRSYRSLAASLRGDAAAAVAPTARPGGINYRGYMRALHLLLNEGVDIGRPVQDLPKHAIYIDVGHDGISREFLLRWLLRRPDVTPIFMIHDVIPLEFPAMVPPASAITHGRVMQLTARYARSVLAPTPAAARAIKAELAHRGAPAIPVHAVSLPIDGTFRKGVAVDPGLGRHPYFLVCGAIEVRKNLGLLLRIWRDLVADLGDRAPRLIIAGRPGFGSGDVIDQITRSGLLDRHVFISSGLSTPAIATLMAGARAVLMPSFAEGFGLPPIEAMAIGTPAILSDLAAHRDAAGAFGIFIDPTDEADWRRQICAMCEDTPAYLALKAHVARFEPQDWRGFMSGVEQILRELP